jgi:hypothetical protein
VLRLRTGDGGPWAALGDLSPAGTDVLRRLNQVLAVRVSPEQRRPVLRRAAGLVQEPATTPLVVPRAHLSWAEDTAAGLRDALRSGGYAVHGDLDRIAVRHRVGARHPGDRDVLDLVLGACLALADPAQRRGREAQ